MSGEVPPICRDKAADFGQTLGVNLPKPTLAPILATLLGSGAGFAVRHWHEARSTAAPALAPHAADGRSGRDSTAGGNGRAATGDIRPELPPSEAAAALAALLRGRADDHLQQLALFLPHADAQAVETLARHYCDPKTAEDGDLCLRLVLARWAEVDPVGSVQFCRTVTPLKSDRDWLLGNAFETWARVDYAAALAAADTPRNRTSALLGLSSTDPLRAFAELEADGGAFRGLGALPWNDVFARLASVDPARAAALVSRAQGGSNYLVEDAVARSWARKDPAAALAWLAKMGADPSKALRLARSWLRGAEAGGQAVADLVAGLPRGPLRAFLQEKLLATEARTDPEGALARVSSMPQGYERQTALSTLVRAASVRKDWRTVVKLGAELGWRMKAADSQFVYLIRTDSRTMTISGGVSDEGAFAAALRQQLAETGDFPAVWKAVTHSPAALSPDEVLAPWLAKDPQAAAKAAMEGGDASGRFARVLGQHWARLDAAAAQRYWAALPESSGQRGTFLHGMSGQLAASDPGSALAWAATLPASAGAEVQRAIIPLWAAREPSEAVQAIQAEPSLQANPELVAAVIASGRSEEPEAVAPLLALLPQGDSEAAQQYAYAYERFTANYAAKDARAASEWIAAMPQGVARDRSISGLVGHLTGNDPDFSAAFAWAGAVGDEAKRTELTTSVFERWRGADRPAAEAAVEQSALPPAAKNRLLSTP